MSVDHLRCPNCKSESQRFQIATIWIRRAPAKSQPKSPYGKEGGKSQLKSQSLESLRLQVASGLNLEPLALYASKFHNGFETQGGGISGLRWDFAMAIENHSRYQRAQHNQRTRECLGVLFYHFKCEISILAEI